MLEISIHGKSWNWKSGIRKVKVGINYLYYKPLSIYDLYLFSELLVYL